MNIPEVRLPRKGRRWCIMGLGLNSSDRSGGPTPTSPLRWSPLLPFQNTALIPAPLDGQGCILPSTALWVPAQGR